MKKTLLVLPFAFIALVLTHAQSRVAGTWQDEVLSGPALQLWTVELSQDGTSVTGTVAWGGLSTEIDAGTIDGDAVVFTFTSPDGDRTITLTGDVTGDEIAFTRDVEVREGGSPGFPGIGGARGARQFTLRRVPDGQAPAQPRGLPYPRQLTVFNRQGEVVRLVGEPGNFEQQVLSPDGTRMAVVKRTKSGCSISPTTPESSSLSGSQVRWPGSHFRRSGPRTAARSRSFPSAITTGVCTKSPPTDRALKNCCTGTRSAHSWV